MQQKKEPENLITSNQAQLLTPLSSGILFKQHALKCIFNNPAVMMCLNEKCQNKNAFQCFSSQCPCQEIHYRCPQGKAKFVIEVVNSKIFNTESFTQTINRLIDKKIDQLSDFRQTLIKLVQQELKLIDLSVEEKKFLKILKGEEDLQDFTSLESKLVWQSSCKHFQTEKSEVTAQIDPYLIKFDKKITKNITDSIQQLQKSINSFIEEKKKKSLLNFPFLDIERLKLQVMAKSSICTTQQLTERFIKLFDKKIRNMSYLYCASHNEFSLEKYFEKCGRVENTVVICKTNMDKIIGGYTPLVFDDLKNNNDYIEDTSGQSFIFSLSDQEKFILKKKTGAIQRRTKKDFIQFGADQFTICDRANSNKLCISYVNKNYYYCPSYSTNDKPAYLKFNGNQTDRFTAKEWQVWKVEL